MAKFHHSALALNCDVTCNKRYQETRHLSVNLHYHHSILNFHITRNGPGTQVIELGKYPQLIVSKNEVQFKVICTLFTESQQVGRFMQVSDKCCLVYNSNNRVHITVLPCENMFVWVGTQ